MRDIAVREAHEKDVGHLILFDALTSLDGEPRYTQDVWEFCTHKGEVMAAFNPRGAVGFMHFQNQSRALFINDIFVAEHFRGQGIGTIFLQAALERAGEKKPVELYVSVQNMEAQKLYNRFGFEVAENKGMSQLHMRREP